MLFKANVVYHSVMKYLAILLLLISPPLFSQSPEWEEIRIFARIKEIKNSSVIFKTENSVATGMKDEKLKKELASIKPGDEALIIGKIRYQPKTIENKTTFTPIFIIESIRPISLKSLGKVKFKEEDIHTNFYPMLVSYSPKSIPLSSDAASAITLTAAVLLMSSLTATGNEIETKQALNQGMIFSAGALATGLFIYDQLKGKP